MKKITHFIFLSVVIAASGNVKVFSQPSVAAPIPPAYSTAKEISIFSDAFPNVANTNFYPVWGSQHTVATSVQIAGNNTLKYANLDYQGMELGSDVNAKPMKYLHLDVWTSDETSIQIYPISRSSGDGLFYRISSLTLNTWNSFDIKLTDFPTGQSFTDIYQFKITGTSGKTIYIDNLYFYDNTSTVDTSIPTAFTATKGVVASNSVELLLNATDDSGAVNFEITYGSSTLKVGGGISGVQKSYKVTGLNPSTPYTFSVVAKDLTGNMSANSPLMVSATTLSAPKYPTISAPVPSIPATKVMSVYSNAYTPLAGSIDYNPIWGQNTVVSTFNIGNDATMEYTTFDFQPIDLHGIFDISKMTKVHLDVFTPNETSLTFQPFSTPSGSEVALTPLTQNTWNSYDIPLSSFTGLNKTGVFQLLFNHGTNNTVYIDNIYFYTDVIGSIAQLDEPSAVTCYPTRVINVLHVSAGIPINRVNVCNPLGQLVMTLPFHENFKTIDLSTLSPGNYFVTIRLSNGQQTTQKVLKL